MLFIKLLLLFTIVAGIVGYLISCAQAYHVKPKGRWGIHPWWIFSKMPIEQDYILIRVIKYTAVLYAAGLQAYWLS